MNKLASGIALFTLCASAMCQVPAASSYKGQIVRLRCECEDSTMTFDASGNLLHGTRYVSLDSKAPQVSLTRSPGLVRIKKMKVRDGRLGIIADRMYLFMQKSSSAPLPQVVPDVTDEISIEQAGANKPEDFEAALAKVFIQSYGADGPLKHPNPACGPRPKSHGTAQPAKTDPMMTFSVDPAFTDDAKRLKISGTTLIGMIITADGMPADICVMRPLGYGLDESAIDAVRKYRFRPATQEGQPVETNIAVEVSFKMYD